MAGIVKTSGGGGSGALPSGRANAFAAAKALALGRKAAHDLCCTAPPLLAAVAAAVPRRWAYFALSDLLLSGTLLVNAGAVASFKLEARPANAGWRNYEGQLVAAVAEPAAS